MDNVQKSKNNHHALFLTKWWSAIAMIVAIWFCTFVYNTMIVTNQQTAYLPENKAIASPRNQSPISSIARRKIEDVKIGNRTTGINLDKQNEQEEDLDEELVELVWKVVHLQMIKNDGTTADIELLRPIWWIETREAYPGETIYLDLAELGAEGDAKVLSVASCPRIQPGPGNLVTGTFRHQASNLIDLAVDGIQKPIGCTANHPFWSADRNEFIQASNLFVGENVQLHNGNVSKVVSSVPRDGTYTVYNLEVYGEHVYEVTEAGILVHNKCAGYHHLWPKSWGNAIPYGDKALTYLKATQHTLIHNKLSEYLAAKTGYAFGSMKGADWIETYGMKELNKLLNNFYKTFSETPEGIKMAKQLGWYDEAGNLMSIYDLFKWEKAEAIRRGVLTIQ